MLYEMRTYTLRMRSLSRVEDAFEAAMDYRTSISPLWGFFHTEIGSLNTIIHIWAYRDLAHLEAVRKTLGSAPAHDWPPPVLDDIVSMESDLLQPAPFMDQSLEPRRLGPVFELRTYDLVPGSRPKVLAKWEAKVQQRAAMSPLAGVWTSLGVGGTQNRLYHLWGYQDLAQRESIRREAIQKGIWPPSSQEAGDSISQYTSQKNAILAPARFSPLR